MSVLDKKNLKYLAELGRVELSESEELKLLKDLQEILNHFQELQKLDTTNIEPMSGGTFTENVVREDKTDTDKSPRESALVEAFPEEENGFLKVPPVFE